MTKEECGFILLILVIVNSLSWLIGWDMELKEKIIIPNIILICCIGIMCALKMMGVD